VPSAAAGPTRAASVLRLTVDDVHVRNATALSRFVSAEFAADVDAFRIATAGTRLKSYLGWPRAPTAARHVRDIFLYLKDWTNLRVLFTTTLHRMGSFDGLCRTFPSGCWSGDRPRPAIVENFSGQFLESLISIHFAGFSSVTSNRSSLGSPVHG
jgi:hypothetical protein